MAVRRWARWSRSVITAAMLVTIRVVGDTIDGAPKTSSRLAIFVMNLCSCDIWRFLPFSKILVFLLFS
jgi:hypothetical protein